jgi:hypothetical protein
VFALGVQAASAPPLLALDWPQLGANAARTNSVPQAITQPYRALDLVRAGLTLRNKAANPSSRR